MAGCGKGQLPAAATALAASCKAGYTHDSTDHPLTMGAPTMHVRATIFFVLGTIFASPSGLHAQSDLQRNLKDTNVGKHWIYNDLKDGFAHAKATGKPLLVVFRCVP